jgi:hypothetical protein
MIQELSGQTLRPPVLPAAFLFGQRVMSSLNRDVALQ